MKKLEKKKLHGFPAFLDDHFKYIYLGSGEGVDYYILKHKTYQHDGGNNYSLEKIKGNDYGPIGPTLSLNRNEYDVLAYDTFKKFLLLL